MEASEGSWLRLGLLWEAFRGIGLSWQALGQSCLMAIMYNGKASESNWVTMQWLHCCNVVHGFMTAHTVLPNIVTIHKRVEIKMANKSNPPHKFTDLRQEFMWLTSPSTDKPVTLFGVPNCFGVPTRQRNCHLLFRQERSFCTD